MGQLPVRDVTPGAEPHLGDHNDIIRPVHNKIENAILTALEGDGFVMGPTGVLVLVVLATQASLNAEAINRVAGDTTLAKNSQTSSYVLVADDAGKVIEMNVSGANTLTVPPNSTIPFSIGTVIEVCQIGVGQTTLTPGTGVTLRSNGGRFKTSGQWASGSLRKRDTNEWVCGGDLTA